MVLSSTSSSSSAPHHPSGYPQDS
ncbi:unnamed protein product, partial [Allacma fusca]